MNSILTVLIIICAVVVLAEAGRHHHLLRPLHGDRGDDGPGGADPAREPPVRDRGAEGAMREGAVRDPGRDRGFTLVELLAYAGDQLSYYQDAVATEAYLGTARRRVSARRAYALSAAACRIS